MEEERGGWLTRVGYKFKFKCKRRKLKAIYTNRKEAPGKARLRTLFTFLSLSLALFCFASESITAPDPRHSYIAQFVACKRLLISFRLHNLADIDVNCARTVPLSCLQVIK